MAAGVDCPVSGSRRKKCSTSFTAQPRPRSRFALQQHFGILSNHPIAASHMTTASLTQAARPAIAGPASGTATAPKRIVSVDVYRGFVMLLMMAEVLSFGSVAQQNPGSAFWRFMAFRQTHVLWVGCSLHDLIQPSFSFLVGVALPYSVVSRLARVDGFQRRHLLPVAGSFLWGDRCSRQNEMVVFPHGHRR